MLLNVVYSTFNSDIYKAYVELYVGNERSRINPDGMYVGNVYSDMNRVTIHFFSFSGKRETFGGLSTTILQHLWHCWASDGVTEWGGGGKGGIYPHLMSGHPFSPVPHPMRQVETCPGGSRGRVMGVYSGEIMAMSRERRVWGEMERKTKYNIKMGLLQHPLYIVLVFPWLVFDTV